MENSLNIANIITTQLASGLSVVLASIVKLEGSSPRHNGTKMVVCQDGVVFGTIGGSKLEAMVIEEGKNIISLKQSKLIEFDLESSGAISKGGVRDGLSSTEMICGGKASVLLDCILPTEKNIRLFKSWEDAVVNKADFYYLTQMSDIGANIEVVNRTILFKDGKIIENIPTPLSELETIRTELHNVSQTTIIESEDKKVVIDPIRRRKTLYCFGAGHVALPTVHIAALLGFQVTVLDDRAEFANAERFPDASNICVLKNFNNSFAELEVDTDSYIVILTRGHLFDREVLEQSLKTNAGYIGMISSRKKRDAVFQALLSKGLNPKELKRVHSPIGIEIGAETPEEIAVSITAELISTRTRQSF